MDVMNALDGVDLRSVAGAALALCLIAGCAAPKYSPYSPHENLLSIAVDFEVAQAIDPYRQPYPQDLTGQNVARATLVRLANYEDLHKGRFTPEIELMRGRALADVGDFVSARRHFAECATFDTPMRAAANEGAQSADDFARVLADAPGAGDLDSFLSALDRQIVAFAELAERFRGTRWELLARVEQEDAQVRRAEVIAANRSAWVDGDERALAALEALGRDHPESRRALDHALRLAEFHLEAARRIERLQDPERGAFDLAAFSNHMESALDVLHRVSLADGRPEKVLARRRLDEVLAYYDLVRRRAR